MLSHRISSFEILLFMNKVKILTFVTVIAFILVKVHCLSTIAYCYNSPTTTNYLWKKSCNKLHFQLSQQIFGHKNLRSHRGSGGVPEVNRGELKEEGYVGWRMGDGKIIKVVWTNCKIYHILFKSQWKLK